MSTKAKKKKAKRSKSMKGWEGLHPGDIPCWRTKKLHAQYRYGAKKGLRRARRRVDKEVIDAEVQERE